jgi:ATP-binding cassette, subfamily B, bacterial
VAIKVFCGGIYLGMDTDSQRQLLNINMLSHSAWRLNCGVVMQEGFIFSDTIARNIAVADEHVDE